MWDKLALILLIIGGVNWGLDGVYILVAIAALWCMTFLFRREALTEPATVSQRR